ncbi:retrovirus-related pol polyprotein from transposon TNT 1-94 [Tanacetum coccineum]
MCSPFALLDLDSKIQNTDYSSTRSRTESRFSIHALSGYDIREIKYCLSSSNLYIKRDTDQAEDAQFQPYEFINPFCTLIQEVAESSSRNVDTSNMHTFYQRHRSDYHWTKDHPLEQVRGNPSKLVQIRRQLNIFKVWELVDKPFGKTVIKLKWLWKNKKDEDNTVVRNTTRLVAKGYAQEELQSLA